MASADRRDDLPDDWSPTTMMVGRGRVVGRWGERTVRRLRRGRREGVRALMGTALSHTLCVNKGGEEEGGGEKGGEERGLLSKQKFKREMETDELSFF